MSLGDVDIATFFIMIFVEGLEKRSNSDIFI